MNPSSSRCFTPYMRIIFYLLAMLVPLSVSAASQTPYAGQESRAIKALSPGEQADLLAGKGMGFAKVAELNGYPGPAHVLELADDLALTPDQRAETEELFRSMLSHAKALGRQLVDAEKSLDGLFESRTVTGASLSETLASIGALRAELRGVHLAAHIEQTRILSSDQIATYQRLRGYAAAETDSGRAHRHKHQH